MIFKNKKHAERFFDASSDSKIESSDRELLASIYLLTSYKKIWKRFENALDEKNGIDPEAFDKFEPKDATEYALVTAACDILFCSEFLNLSDFADSDTIFICYFFIPPVDHVILHGTDVIPRPAIVPEDVLMTKMHV